MTSTRQWTLGVAEALDVRLGQALQALELDGCHQLIRRRRFVADPRLHLDEHQLFAVPRHEVDLSPGSRTFRSTTVRPSCRRCRAASSSPRRPTPCRSLTPGPGRAAARTRIGEAGSRRGRRWPSDDGSRRTLDAARSRSRDGARRARRARRSRYTFATIDAAAIERQRRSPWMMPRWGIAIERSLKQSTSKKSGVSANVRTARTIASSFAAVSPSRSISSADTEPTPTARAPRPHPRTASRATRGCTASSREPRPGSRRVTSGFGQDHGRRHQRPGPGSTAGLVHPGAQE